MKVVLINKSDSTGGAAVVTLRLLNALLDAGIDAMMLVTEKRHDSPRVELAASPAQIKRSFLAERLKIFLANGLNRDTLFKIDTATDGLPLHRNRYVRDADVVCLNWVNQGMLSLSEIEKILRLGKPVIWTMHDMWNFTGVCHHAGTCRRFLESCGDCPLLGRRGSASDMSHSTWERKMNLYSRSGGRMHFVAVSNWLASLARKSSLIGENMPLSVIPNAFPFPEKSPARKSHGDRFVIAMGAARLDDPVKGLPILVEATKILARDYPADAKRMELVTFGAMKNPDALAGVGISHRHLGTLHGEEAIREVYTSSDAVVSTSLYETLPGTLVEGLAYGAVPVSFSRGGQPDIVDHLSTGYLAEWSDDLEKAARNIAEGLLWAMRNASEEMREKMERTARERFSAQSVANSYIRLFQASILA